MGKQGPCCHCGVTSTPLWRNGPPDKPVLCNACGSRWRTKGTLVNYTPLHSRSELDDFDDYKRPRVRNMFIKNNDTKVPKRKRSHDNAEVAAFASNGNQVLRKSFDEDGSNRSSSGSAISNSDSCALFGGADASELTGPSQSIVWDTTVPSRKRTCVSRPKSSPIEKLTKDLYTILQEQQASCLSGSSEEEDVLLETDRPMVSVEIGHGSVLIRHPSSIAREEESESSSLSVDNKLHRVNEAYSRLTSFPVNTDNKGVNVPNLGIEKLKKLPNQSSIEQDQAKRDLLEKLQLLGRHNSPLRCVSLGDVINFDLFVSCLTDDEQLQMHRYLPSVDTSRPPESLKSMFKSPQFQETLSSFQKILGEGVFDNSLYGVTTEECRTLKRHILCNLAKSKRVEQYSLLKDAKCKSNTSVPEGAMDHDTVTTCHSINTRKARDGQSQKLQGAMHTTESPKSSLLKENHGNKEPLENDVSSFGPRNLFILPPDDSTLALNSFQSADASSDLELLLHVPSNSSFPQAELFYPTSSFSAQASTSSSSIYSCLLRP